MITWGISGNSHDAALAVFNHQPWNKGSMKLLYASHAERYSGIKNDAHLNQEMVDYARDTYGEPDEVIWYEKPLLKTLRQIKAGQGFRYWKKNNIKAYLKNYGITCPIRYSGHHRSHVAGGYYSSGLPAATIMVIDSMGEFDTLTIWDAVGTSLKPIYKQAYPHSIGLWYSAFTQRIGLKPQEDEYILMGMAAYGDPLRFMNEILQEFFYPIDDHGWLQTFWDRPRVKLRHNLHRGCLWWRPELNKPQDLMDIAAAVQAIYAYLLKYISNWARWKSPSGNLILMGGCALNCAANSTITSDWNNVWIMPNPGDSGSAIGAVLSHYDTHIKWPGPYLGHNIEGDYPVEEVLNELLTTGICGVANGRAEFGPRALGHRSLLADPRGEDIKDRVNNIKQRQLFRPFAPAVLEEHAKDYFNGPTGHYMQYTSTCTDTGLPAIIHGDGTSRVQTVSTDQSVGFRKLLERWYEETGCPILLNTSLNIKGKPIVNNLTDAEDFANMYNVKVYTHGN
jgi:carbamoyltransferase